MPVSWCGLAVTLCVLSIATSLAGMAPLISSSFSPFLNSWYVGSALTLHRCAIACDTEGRHRGEVRRVSSVAFAPHPVSLALWEWRPMKATLQTTHSAHLGFRVGVVQRSQGFRVV